jgi:hypothetical protein
MSDSSRPLRALHEAGHAVVGKALGHEVYRIHLGDDGDYCDGGYLSASPDGDPPGRRKRALIALGGYFATALYGQDQGFDVSDWDVASGDWEEFEAQRDGRSFRHARRVVIGLLREKRDELLALAERVALEGDVCIDPHPSEYAEEVVCL